MSQATETDVKKTIVKTKTMDRESIIESISNLTVLELSELIKELEDRFGIKGTFPMAAPSIAAQGPSPAAEMPKEEEKTEFSVILVNIGSQKIQVIKEVRALTSLGLKEAKELVESAPKPIKEGISKEEAEKIKAKLEEVGATVEIK